MKDNIKQLLKEFGKGATSMEQIVVAKRTQQKLVEKHTFEEAHVLRLLKEARLQVNFQEILYIGTSFIIVDFLLPKRKIILELDGGQHFTPEKLKTDLERDRALAAQGYKVIRVTNSHAYGLSKAGLLELLKQKKIGNLLTRKDTLTFGKYKGYTMTEMLAKHKEYLVWLYRSYICTFEKSVLAELFLV
jgi:very-short-patch-repair endonuclease/uncharacterized protein (DUF3820 family)